MTKTNTPETCSLCASKTAFTSMQNHEFDYRHNGEMITLSVQVPVTECETCDEAYFGDGAEEIKHEAVCTFLGRLSPKEIVQLRKKLSMSQAQLADATEIGIASIKRWERGLIIQGAALDRQLRNLEPEVMHEAVSPWAGTFRTHITEAARQKAQNFTLRPRQSRQLEAMACM